MSETVMRAPTFTRILGVGADIPDRTVLISFLAANNKKYEVAISAVCAPLAVTAITGQLGKILATLPEQDRPPVQPIVAVGAVGAMQSNGAPALIVVLEDGAELTFEFRPEDLARMADQLSELAKMVDRSAHH